jgi:CubicO group peptidase (beta-lactamase class C family)
MSATPGRPAGDEVDRRLASWVTEARAPGLSVAAVQRGTVTYARGFGTTSVEDAGVPITPRTLFHIASTTKPLTGTALLRLVERGLLELDRPIPAYVPRLRLDAGAAERITLRMLLSHTSGLPSGRYRPVGAREASALGAWARRGLSRCRLVAPPGTAYRYSNLGVSLVGCVAEAVTGTPFAELMQELVFDPLEMRRTTFDPTVAMTYPVALGHGDDERGGLEVVHGSRSTRRPRQPASPSPRPWTWPPAPRCTSTPGASAARPSCAQSRSRPCTRPRWRPASAARTATG